MLSQGWTVPAAPRGGQRLPGDQGSQGTAGWCGGAARVTAAARWVAGSAGTRELKK